MRNLIWDNSGKALMAIGLILILWIMTSTAQDTEPPATVEAAEASAEATPAETHTQDGSESSEDRIKLPMVQCLNREELQGLMGQCWTDAKVTGDTVESRATLAAAIFAVRADNIQSGKEPYMREWTVQGATDD